MTQTKSPWTIDASKLDHGDQSHGLDLIRNGVLDRFLELSPGSHRAVLVAGKGQGKTLALLCKARAYHDKGIKCLPTGNNLIERIPQFHLSMQERTLILNLTMKATWSLIWEVAIAAALMYLKKDESSQDAIFGDLFLTANKLRINSGSVANYALWLIQSNRNFEKAKDVLPLVRTYIEQIAETIGVFIDNIDEALEEVCDPIQFEAFAQGIDSTLIWINAQLGLIDAIDQYRKINKKIIVSATIRIEAYKKYPTDRASNIDEFCEELTYDRKDLEAIFALNVKMEDPSNLASPFSNDMSERFFGRKTFTHDRVVSEADIPINENIFECILRHTLGRPRDLMRIGGHISRTCNPIGRSDDRPLREAIRLGAGEVFEKYKGESFPRWDHAYDLFLDFIPSNVVSRQQMNRMANAFEWKFPGKKHPGCYYLQRGLIGTIKENKQFFLPPNTYLAADKRFPTEEFFFVHPCMTGALNDARVVSDVSKSKFSARHICGNGLPVDPEDFVKRVPPRLRFGLCAGVFQFELDGMELQLSQGHSQARLLLGILLRAVVNSGRTELDVVKDLNPVARDLAKQLGVKVLDIDPDSREIGTLLPIFQQAKFKSGISPLKQINKICNDFPFCCNVGAYSKIDNPALGKGPITQRVFNKSNDYKVYFDICKPNEIEEFLNL